MRNIIGHPVLRFLVRRMSFSAVLLFAVSALSFLLVSLTPGNAAIEILGPQATPQEIQALKQQLGLTLPLYDQYWRWLVHALHGDLGRSLISDGSVTTAIDQRLPVTLSLIAGAVLVSIVLGGGVGIVAAVRQGLIDRFVSVLSFVGFSLPAFWIGAVLIALFAVKVRWFPVTGYVPLSQSPVDWLRSLVLPVVALALGGIAIIGKQMRASMLDVLGSEHIRIARANGIPEKAIILRHALKNASVPVVTVIGVYTIGLLGGTVFVETVFALPGLGSFIVAATMSHDLPVVQGIAVYFTLIVIVLNMVTDLTYGWLNPRIRR